MNSYKLCRNDTKTSAIYDKIYTVHDRFFTNTMRKIVRMLQYLLIERVEKGSNRKILSYRNKRQVHLESGLSLVSVVLCSNRIE